MTLIQNPTTKSAAETMLEQHEQLSGNALESLRQATLQTFAQFWRGPVPPADLLAAMGTNAVAAFEQHARAVGFLLASGVVLAPEDYTSPLAYTAHQDGTITLD